jgi:hypothetical protein
VTEAMMLGRIVEVFCELDDFCKAFLLQWEAFLTRIIHEAGK